MTSTSNNRISISAEINAGVEKTWNYYTLPEHIVNWNFANNDWCCPHAENDLKVGGQYLARMEAKDGSFGFNFSAEYTLLDLHKRITYKLEDGRSVDIRFLNKIDCTEIEIHFDPEEQNSRDMQEQGWQAILNNFKNYTENN